MPMYKVTWYDQDSVVATEPPFEATDKEDARTKAYTKHNGNPPAPMIMIEEVK